MVLFNPVGILWLGCSCLYIIVGYRHNKMLLQNKKTTMGGSQVLPHNQFGTWLITVRIYYQTYKWHGEKMCKKKLDNYATLHSYIHNCR